jgi:hypothetical protein
MWLLQVTTFWLLPLNGFFVVVAVFIIVMNIPMLGEIKDGEVGLPFIMLGMYEDWFASSLIGTIGRRAPRGTPPFTPGGTPPSCLIGTIGRRAPICSGSP